MANAICSSLSGILDITSIIVGKKSPNKILGKWKAVYHLIVTFPDTSQVPLLQVVEASNVSLLSLVKGSYVVFGVKLVCLQLPPLGTEICVH